MMIPIETEFDRMFKLVTKAERSQNERLIRKMKQIRNTLYALKFSMERQKALRSRARAGS
ncbi:hypothetical protein WDW86_05010 [Bdellovibrionota bacterium FG-2]